VADNLRLVVMTFPQRWDPSAATLSVNALLVPAVSPIDDPLVGSALKFADHVPDLRAVVIGSLDVTPKSTDPTAARIVPVIVNPQPAAAPRPGYNKLIAQAQAGAVTISGSGALAGPASSTIRKALPQSYLDAAGAAPGGATATTDEFGCAIRGQTGYTAQPPARTTGWGPILSYALRQPVLATALGLRYELQVKLADPAVFAGGGWLFIEIAAGDPWAQAATPGQIRLYAGRLPALGAAARQLFAAVLFPVDAVGAIDDAAFGVAETYDDGFAKIVHLYQPQANDAVIGDNAGIPAATDAGVQIGWDDEQVVAWQNGQIQIMNDRFAGKLDAQTPLGVLGYRVDVADVTANPSTPAWHSLVPADVELPQGFGHFTGELAIEPTALRPQDPSNPSAVSGDAWLPRYFANWRGGSLVVADPVPKAMLDAAPITATPDPVGVLLAYGRSYAFRVRLADLTNGGPAADDHAINAGQAGVASLDFLRWVPPKKPGIRRDIPSGATIPEALTFMRPLIGYPEALYTALGDTDTHRGQIVEYFTKNAHPGSGVVVGLPDPDVDTLEITIEVRTPLHDVAGDGVLDTPFRELYRATRPFPALPSGPLPADPGLRVDLAYVDAASIVDWAPSQPATGPLVLPRARDVRITARAIGRNDPSYFAPQAATGLPASLILRAEARQEPSLLVSPVDGSSPLRGILFKRPPGVDAPPVAAQLAEELGLIADGLTLAAPPGRRVVFGASKALRHALPGDNSTITFAAESELLRYWVAVLVVDLERDWTWDGLANNSTVTVERDGTTVGSLRVARTLGAAAVADPANWDRRRTRLVFFDAVDPHEQTSSGFPEALTHTWTLSAAIVTETGPQVGVSGSPALKPGAVPEPAAADLNNAGQTVTLPIAVPPAQIPSIASVGLALSPFEAGPGYATTAPRARALWVELAAPVANAAGDALFARVLGHGADPLLYDAQPRTEESAEPPLTLDPELMRVITPGESDDRAGLSAMTQLERASDSNVHFLLPLPPGLDPGDPELFGFYTYELRIGHAGDAHDHRWWSTAQGRFGRPIRVNGVQHPAPPLPCRAGRLRLVLPVKGGAAASPVTPFRIPAQFLDSAAAAVRAATAGATLTAHAALRLASLVVATATYATPVLDGRPLVGPNEAPRTTLYFFLYAQVVQADGASNRNVLLFQREGTFFGPALGAAGRARFSASPPSQRDRVGGTVFTEVEIEARLQQLGLPVDLPLSVLAVELLPGGVGSDLPAPRTFAARPAGAATPAAEGTTASAAAAREQNPDPLGLNNTPRRILRASTLVQVAAIC